jgi:hypothetical protein
MPNITEQALRAAASGVQADIVTGVNYIGNLKDSALSRAKEMLGGSCSASVLGTQMDLQSMAINAAVEGLKLAYSTVCDLKHDMEDKRIAFDKERIGKLATFLVPTNIETKNLSIEEKLMKSFLGATYENPRLRNYFGIQKGQLAEMKDFKFFSVIPFHTLNNTTTQPVASPSAIDKVRTSIGLFFSTALADAIDYIDTLFQTHWKVPQFFISAYERRNYLNDLRTKRFIMICVANLLWHIQHPVHPETGYPLSVESNIHLCGEVLQFLNKLLMESDPSYIGKLCHSNKIIAYVQRVEMEVKTLRSAFVTEHLHTLNITDLTNTAHHTLRLIDQTMLQLVFKRKNSITDDIEPYTTAAQTIADSVSFLNELLADNPDLTSHFQKLSDYAKNTPFINIPLTTTIDILIAFLHSPKAEKDHIIKALVSSKIESENQFGRTLREFYERFVAQMDDISYAELNGSIFEPKSLEVAELTAKRLVPFLTLVADDYRIEVDTIESVKQATSPQEVKKYTAKEQLADINFLAHESSGYYTWNISPFIELATETEDILDSLPKYQYRLTEITKLLDSIGEIVVNYRTFLQRKEFQEFLIKCLNKIQNEYSLFSEHLKKVSDCLRKDKSINRNLQEILYPMISNLTNGVKDFKSAFSTFEHIIKAPDFTDQQKRSLSEKLDFINKQYKALFGSPCSDLGAMKQLTKDNSPSMVTIPKLSRSMRSQSLRYKPSAPHPEAVIASPLHSGDASLDIDISAQTIELRHLIHECMDSLSLLSRYGQKGQLMHQLLLLIDGKPELTEADIRKVLVELTRITISYRPSPFFQAHYGETKSSHALIAALKNKDTYSSLPIAKILFGSNIDLAQIDDAQISHRLRTLGTKSKWKESCNEIAMLPGLV